MFTFVFWVYSSFMTKHRYPELILTIQRDDFLKFISVHRKLSFVSVIPIRVWDHKDNGMYKIQYQLMPCIFKMAYLSAQREIDSILIIPQWLVFDSAKVNQLSGTLLHRTHVSQENKEAVSCDNTVCNWTWSRHSIYNTSPPGAKLSARPLG